MCIQSPCPQLTCWERQTGNEGQTGARGGRQPAAAPSQEAPRSGCAARPVTWPLRSERAVACPAPRWAPLTGDDPGSEVELDDASAEGRSHHAQGCQEATREHDGPAAKAVHTHAAEWAWGRGAESWARTLPPWCPLPQLSRQARCPGCESCPDTFPSQARFAAECPRVGLFSVCCLGVETQLSVKDRSRASSSGTTYSHVQCRCSLSSDRSYKDLACAGFGPVESHGFGAERGPPGPCPSPTPRPSCLCAALNQN